MMKILILFETRNFIYSLVPVVQRVFNMAAVAIGYFWTFPFLIFYDYYFEEPFWESGMYFFEP